jgi:hypothetical protein
MPESSVIVSLEPASRPQLDTEREGLLARPLPAALATAEDYAALAADQARVQAFIKRVEPDFDEVCTAAHKAWKHATGLRSKFFEGLHTWNERARQLLGAFKSEQERQRRAEELRIAAEDRAREDERRRAEAAALDQQGHRELAAAVLDTPTVPAPVVLPSRVPDVPGLHYIKRWSWRIAGCVGADGGRKDKVARKRAAGLVPREYLDLDDGAITARVTNMGSAIRLPGIEIYEEQVPVRR